MLKSSRSIDVRYSLSFVITLAYLYLFFSPLEMLLGETIAVIIVSLRLIWFIFQSSKNYKAELLELEEELLELEANKE